MLEATCLPWLPLRQLSPPTSVLEVLQHSTCNSCLGFQQQSVENGYLGVFCEIVNDGSWNGYSMPTNPPTHQPLLAEPLAGSAAAQQVIRHF